VDKEFILKFQLSKKEKLIEELQKENEELRKETREEVVKSRKENEVNEIKCLGITACLNNSYVYFH